MKKILLIVPALIIAAIGTMNAQTIIYSQDMQSTTGTALPTGWTQTTLATDGGWKSGTALNSSYFGIPAHTRYLATNDDACNCNKSNDFLKTSSFSLAGTTYPEVSFDLYYYAGTYSTYVETATVEVSTDGGTTWTVVETLPGAGAWVTHATNLTAYAGQTNVMLGFRYNDGGAGNAAAWMYGEAIDNVTVLEPVSKEVIVNRIIMNKYVLAGSQPVSTVFTSMGGPTVTSATLLYSVDGGAPVTQVFTPNISYNASYTANFTTNATLAAGLHTIKSWITDVNGTGPDATQVNDTASFFITVLTSAPVKNVVVEEFTGAWCGYCPRGGVTLSALSAADPKIIGAAIHGGGTDNMATAEGTTVINSYASGFPTGMVDRSYVSTVTTPGYAIDDADWGATATTRESAVVPATVALSNVSFNSGTRTVTATVTATFVGDVKGPFSLNLYLTENYVFGPTADQTDNGWNQHSYYYATSGSPFQGIGLTTSPWSTSVAGLMPSMYVHNHVVDKMVGGAYGDNTIIPTTVVTSGTTFQKIFTFVLPAANPGGAHRYNADNIYLIGMVEEYDANNKANRYILNATELKLNTNPEATGIADLTTTEFGSLIVFPNPASTEATVGITLNSDENVVVNVFNSLGQLVYNENEGKLAAGEHMVTLNTEKLATGIYNVSISTSKGVISKKVTISK